MKALLLAGFGVVQMALCQQKASNLQEAGNCSVNISGSNNTASLVCKDVDPKIAGQVQAILNGTRRNEKAAKDIFQKLDAILRELDKQAIHVQQHSTGPNSPNTVNINQRPLPRRIPAERLSEIVGLLARRPGKVSVSAILNNPEAHDFAQDWYNVFKAAQWTMADTVVRTFSVVGRPERGIFIRLSGESAAPGAEVRILKDTPVGVLSEAIERLTFKTQVRAQRFPDLPENQISLEILDNPEN